MPPARAVRMSVPESPTITARLPGAKPAVRRMLRTTAASGLSGCPGRSPRTATNRISGKNSFMRASAPSWNLLDATASLTPLPSRSRSSSGMPGNGLVNTSICDSYHIRKSDRAASTVASSRCSSGNAMATRFLTPCPTMVLYSSTVCVGNPRNSIAWSTAAPRSPIVSSSVPSRSNITSFQSINHKSNHFFLYPVYLLHLQHRLVTPLR